MSLLVFTYIVINKNLKNVEETFEEVYVGVRMQVMRPSPVICDAAQVILYSLLEPISLIILRV